jgi:hypothetical protein
MKYQTDELEGALLDAAVAKAEGRRFEVVNGRCGVSQDAADPLGQWFEPSTDWRDAGPIIERHGIWLRQGGNVRKDGELFSLWVARVGDMGFPAYGKTPLIAAMRAFVKSKLGEEVEL